MTSRDIALIAAAAVALTGAAFWFLGGSAPAPGHVAVAPPPPPPEHEPEVTTPPPPERRPRTTAEDPPAPAPEPPPDPLAGLGKDDRKIEELLRLFPGNSEADHTNTAQALINLLPTLSKAGQFQAMPHVCNLLSDKEFPRVMHLWRNPGTDRHIIDIMATDLMNRDHKVMLPAMLDAARQPAHPFHENAKTNLSVFLNGDYGGDIAKMEAAMKDVLRREAGRRPPANAPQPAPPATPQ